jgi:hypothetical protein
MGMRFVARCASLFLAAAMLPAPPAAAQQKDYLTTTEADKVRDANDSSERIKLFVSFASDRLKQWQYELDHPADTVRRSERLNALLNAFSGCLDEAVDRVELGVEHQDDVRDGIKAVQSQAPEFLTYLTKLAATGPERNTYKDNLDDAIASAKDAIRSVADASKEDEPPPPVRRRPQ